MSQKTFDELGLITEGSAVTTTASTTGVNIVGLNLGDAAYHAVIDASAVAGTFDGSNYYTVALEASDSVGGTYVKVGNVAEIVATGRSEIGFTSVQLNSLVDGADFFRVTVTKVGTTATGVTVTAFLTRV